jgi:hypothetical protein
MEAAIALFAAIDPHAAQLRIFSGFDEDTLYMRNGEKWEEARRSRRTAPGWPPNRPIPGTRRNVLLSYSAARSD